MSTAVVFAYHDVGVRCLSVLLARGVDVPLVVTHEDDPGETIWFGSVAETARRQGIPVVTPASPKDPELLSRIAAIAPDLVFSFYYRRMIPDSLLRLAARGAFNMHGSLLPKFRGRSPVNWAIVKGAKETGATLHRMVSRADAGAIVGQEAIPILLDDTAVEVVRKVTGAAERVLDRSLASLLAGTAVEVPQVEAEATTFGGRTPADGRIDWHGSAASVHNLVRAVAPPYPGAFTELRGETIFLYRTRLEGTAPHRAEPRHLHGDGGACFAVCGDGQTVRLLEAARGGAPLDLAELARKIEGRPVPL